MVVKELMKTDVVWCAPGDTLAEVAKLMRDHNCGFIPVINSNASLVGVITERDRGRATGSSGRPAERMCAGEVMRGPVYGCFADENVKAVLATMAAHHVRRLPVIDKKHGHLVGVLSLDDVAMAPHRRGSPSADDFADTFRRIVMPRAVIGRA